MTHRAGPLSCGDHPPTGAGDAPDRARNARLPVELSGKKCYQQTDEATLVARGNSPRGESGEARPRPLERERLPRPSVQSAHRAPEGGAEVRALAGGPLRSPTGTAGIEVSEGVYLGLKPGELAAAVLESDAGEDNQGWWIHRGAIPLRLGCCSIGCKWVRRVGRMANAPVLKTGGRKPIRVRIPGPPLDISS